ncbi:MAG: hypothetical protein GMKNLPBB_01085 [Myxococcota bacterium]|nr:hypothetical protein [Myxococcota bacterium]
MHPRHWWKYLLAVLVIGAAGVMYMGAKTYSDAPPVPDFAGPDGTVLITSSQVLDGQEVFLKRALMNYGSMFGDGAGRGPDFTAEALNTGARAMQQWYEAAAERDPVLADQLMREGVAGRVQHDIRHNAWNAETNTVRLTAAQAAAWKAVQDHYTAKFASRSAGAFQPAGLISDPGEIHLLSAFFFWGAWVCGAERPGTGASYTHNWPYDELAGNRPTPGTSFWSVMGSLALILALGGVLYLHGRYSDAETRQPEDISPPATIARVSAASASGLQRLTYAFFVTAMALFLLQVIAGVFTVHDFLGFTTFFGINFSEYLPVTVTRSWHVQFAVQWIAACWIAGSLFVLPRIAPQPPSQVTLAKILFGMLVIVVAGTLVGGVLGPHGLLGEYWRALGNQGWEFVELGRVFQWILFGVFILWAIILIRGVWPALGKASPFSIPNWMLYTTAGITLLFASGFVSGPRANFVIADFWRWCVIHMWAECFFEVFTTVIASWFLVTMGVLGRQRAERIVFLAVLLFLGSGLLGISHNFYWNAKPEPMLAIGSVFSTMQVIPLIMVTAEAWRFRRLPRQAMRNEGGVSQFGLTEPFLFLLGVNFWNFLGAGVFGFIINLPIVNYFEHGTYLTVNHGHAALFGVYGNLSIAAALFCARYLLRAEAWSPRILRISFWSLNGGLLLMVLMHTLPLGVAQFMLVLREGYAAARSHTFVEGPLFQTLTWMRAIGGVTFFLGGVVPLVWFFLSRANSLKPPAPEAAMEKKESGMEAGAAAAPS